MSTKPVTLQQELDAWRTPQRTETFKRLQKAGPAKRNLAGWLKSAKAEMASDKSAGLRASRDRILDLASQIDQSALSDTERQQLANSTAQAKDAVATYDASWPTYLQEVTSAAARLKGANALRVLGQWVLSIIGVICIPSPAWWFGLLLIVGVIVAGTILKRQFTRQAWDLHGVATRPSRVAHGILGGPPRGKLDASGLYADVDHIWIRHLSPAARGAELQLRAAEKAEAQSNAAQSNAAHSQAATGDYAWLRDPRITDQITEIMSNIGGSTGDRLDRTVVLNALKSELPSYATVEEALPVLRDIVERQWNKFGDNGQTNRTISASERVLYNDEQ